MTRVEQLEMVKAMIEPGDSENTLSVYLDLAGGKILERAYPFGRSDADLDGDVCCNGCVPERYHMLQVEIAVFMLNKRGAEGQTSHSESGVSRSYAGADVPQELIGQVVPMCGVL